MIISLWELRNEEVHGKEEVTKQQKRKAEAAIRVRALHNRQEIARPSDSFLFYQDIGEEIKHAIVVKLDEFNAMKTKLIHNSVNKEAKRAKRNVKLIVKQIRIGGKNNRTILKRVEKRDRDHF